MNTMPKHISIDFPRRMLRALDREAERIGVACDELIKFWVEERLAKVKST